MRAEHRRSPWSLALALSLAGCVSEPSAPPAASGPAQAPLGPPPSGQPGPPPSGQPGPPPSGPPGPPPLPPLHQPPGFHAEVHAELQGSASQSPSSILIISLDTVSAQSLALYGGVAKTPNLAALAARGTVFEQAVSHFPETCLSHWSMLSGVLPVAHGNAPANRGSLYTGPTLVEVAGISGYSTGGFIGGVTLQDSSCGLGRGFDVYDDRVPQNPLDFTRPAPQVTAQALRWIREQQGPYVAFVHYFDAHFPYTPGAPWDSAYDPDYSGTLSGSDADLRPYRDGGQTPSQRDLRHIEALYHGEISQLDAALGPLLQAVGEEVIVVVTADHGESFGHDYYFNHREALWDEVIVVPLIIAGPGFEVGARVSAQVGLVDIAPTVLRAAGLPVDAGMSTRDLREGGSEQVFSSTDPWREQWTWSARSLGAKVLRDQAQGRWSYDLAGDPKELSMLGPGPSSEGLYAQYRAELSQSGARQTQPPQHRPMGEEQLQQLQVLGYQAPAR